MDAIYNPLPNGLHFEWTMKALQGGKHVLLEKPATDTADEARQIFALAEKKGLVVLEAFHYRSVLLFFAISFSFIFLGFILPSNVSKLSSIAKSWVRSAA